MALPCERTLRAIPSLKQEITTPLRYGYACRAAEEHPESVPGQGVAARNDKIQKMYGGKASFQSGGSCHPEIESIQHRQQAHQQQTGDLSCRAGRGDGDNLRRLWCRRGLDGQLIVPALIADGQGDHRDLVDSHFLFQFF